MNAKKNACFVLGYLAFLNQKFRMRTRVVPVLFFGVGIGILSAGFSYVTAEANVPSSIVSKAIAVTSPVNLAINADSKSRTRVEVLDGSRWVTVNWRAEGFERGDTCLVNIAFAPTSVGSLDSSQVFQNISYLSTLLGSTVGTSWVKVSKNIVPQSVTIYPRISCVHQGLTYSANKAVCVDCNSTWKEEPAVLTVASKTFKNVLYGQSGYEEIYIKYSGNLKADNVVVRGLTEAGSGITNEGGSNMPCGSSISTDCVIRVKFTPELVAKSALSNSNNVVSDPRYVTIDYFNGKQNISVPFLVTTISTPKATLGVSPSSLDFGVVNQKTRVSKILKLSNQVKGSQLTAVTIPDSINSPFSISENCPDTMSADNSCDVSVAFEPTSEQKYVNSLSVSASDGVTTQTQSVQLQGELQYPKNPAVLSVDTVTMSAKSFKDTVTKSVLIKYSGAENATIDSVTGLGNGVSFVGGTFPGTGGTCQKIISADCTIVLNYSFLNSQNSSALVKPGGSSPVSFVIVMNYANGVSSDVKSTSFLVNTSVIEPRGLLATSLSDINFGQISGSASKIITVSSSVPGSRLSKIKVSPLENPFSVSQGSDCRDDVTNSQRCTLYVMYNPEANTTSSASFAITTSDGVSLQSKTINVIGSAKGLMNSRGQQIGATPGSVVSTDVAKVSIPHEPPAIIIEGSTGTSEVSVGDNGTDLNNITLPDITEVATEKKIFELNVKHVGISPVTLTNISELNMKEGFQWLGGHYPGLGGTCGNVISSNCTLILELLPDANHVVVNHAFKSLHNKSLRMFSTYFDFTYVTDSQKKKTRLLGVNLDVFAPMVGSIKVGEYAPIFGVLKEGGESVTKTISVETDSDINASFITEGVESSSRNVIPILKSITLEGLQSPFSHAGTDCKEVKKPFPKKICDVKITYTPPALGELRFKNDIGNVILTATNGISSVSRDYILNATTIPKELSIDVSKDVLIVYNKLSPDSIEVKDYYINHRPGMNKAAVTSISIQDPCAGVPEKTTTLLYPNHAIHDYQSVTKDDYLRLIKNPLTTYLNNNPTIKYIIMMPGVPMRFIGEPHGGSRYVFSIPDDLSSNISVGSAYEHNYSGQIIDSIDSNYFVPSLYPGTRALITYVNMVDKDKTIAYIDKLERMYKAMPVKSLIISSKDVSGYEKGLYYADGYTSDKMYLHSNLFELGVERMKNSIPESRIVLHTDRDSVNDLIGIDGSAHPAIDVAGYYGWGIHNLVYGEEFPMYTPEKPLNRVKFSGKSDWYLMMTEESFNGIIGGSGGQSTFRTWFHELAFGGTNYSNTPVAAVVHIDEPGGGSTNSTIFACFDKGELPFVECAWKSVTNSNATVFIGDPFITR
jgi:hypothetical protein